MGKPSKYNSMACCLVIAILYAAYSTAYANPHVLEQEVPLSKNLGRGGYKAAILHLYVQDKLGGSDATVWEVAVAEITGNSTSSFGQVRVMDDLITATPDRNSRKLGRAQGMITYCDLNEPALTMNINFYLTAGRYKGSTLTVVGRKPIDNESRELPVVGGTGVFRMARGYSISRTHSFDVTANYGVLEYTFYLFYLPGKTLAKQLLK